MEAGLNRVPKGINHHRELMAEHSPADFFGKTGTHEQATALVANLFS